MTSFTRETIDVETQSGHKYKLRSLSAREQMNADSINQNMTSTLYYRIASAIAEIDGQARPVPTNDLELEEVLDMVSGRDVDELVLAYAKWMAPKGDDLKNSSTPAA